MSNVKFNCFNSFLINIFVQILLFSLFAASSKANANPLPTNSFYTQGTCVDANYPHLGIVAIDGDLHVKIWWNEGVSEEDKWRWVALPNNRYSLTASGYGSMVIEWTKSSFQIIDRKIKDHQQVKNAVNQGSEKKTAVWTACPANSLAEKEYRKLRGQWVAQWEREIEELRKENARRNSGPNIFDLAHKMMCDEDQKFQNAKFRCAAAPNYQNCMRILLPEGTSCK